MQMNYPMQKEFIPSTFRAYHNLGGSGQNKEIYLEVAKIMDLSEEQRSKKHPSKILKFHKDTQWAIQKLKETGYIKNVRRGFYTLTDLGSSTEAVDPDRITRKFNKLQKLRIGKKVKLPSGGQVDSTQQNMSTANLPSEDVKPPEVQQDPIKSSPISPIESIISNYANWQNELLDTLRQMPAKRFARFIRQILQRSGLAKIEVIRSDDSTCEGIAEMGGGLMSPTRVHFRCLRGSHQVISEDVINFRREVGMSRAVQGMLIALGGFTQAAEREAKRMSTPMIDIIDGEKLAAKLKELNFGVKSEIVRVERVTVDADFFNSI